MKLKQNIIKGLTIGMVLANIPIGSSASSTSVDNNKYIEDAWNIETKSNLQKI